MPVFLDPRGRATYGIGICARCSEKFFLDELSPDPNSPGLMVCDKDKDVLDPYRLPARQTEQITLPFNRPDVQLTDSEVIPTSPLSAMFGPLTYAITLTWSVESPVVTSYDIYRQINSGAFVFLTSIDATQVLTYTDSAILSGNTYSYYVISAAEIPGSPDQFSSPSNIAQVAAPNLFTQVFLTGGTWTKIPGLVSADIMVIGGGGGGGSGQNAVGGGSPAGAGGGGGGGGAQILGVSSSLLPSSVLITVGSAGAGAAPGSSTVGNPGTASTFGSFIVAMGGGGGGAPGSGGNAPGGTASINTLGSGTTQTGGIGGPGTNQIADSIPGGSTTLAGAGGGSGFPTTSFVAPFPAGAGGACGSLAGGAGGDGYAGGTLNFPVGNPGGAGNNGTDAAGSGGGGGGPAIGPNATFGGSGGNGGLYGAGGGGGCYAQNYPVLTIPPIGGGGGNGAPGIIVVTSRFT